MSARHAPRHALLAALALAGCGKTSAVELRLYPCALAGGAPMNVQVAIQSYGSGGDAIGERIEKSFPIGDPAVFSDDYATVDFVPPEGTATADFTLTWSAGGTDAVATYTQVAVPKPGGALVLGSDECEGQGGSSGDPSSTTGTTADGTTGDETTGTTGGSSTGWASTTGTGTTWESTGDASTSSGSTGGSTGGTTGDPMEGGPCDAMMEGDVICDGGPGVLGQFLKCAGGTWTKDEGPHCNIDNACPPELGLVNPKMIGCMGDGTSWTCACADVDMTMKPKECAPPGVSKCGEEIDVFVKVELCVPDGGKLYHYVGLCLSCDESVPGQPLCVQQ